jgi:hypothetical protein
MEKAVLRDNYLLDLMDGNELTCDSYLHFWFLSRGGMTNFHPESRKSGTLFDIDLSFGHKLEVDPLPAVPSHFSDLIFISRMTKLDLWNHPGFQEEVRKITSF